jgi:hypothetical protein
VTLRAGLLAVVPFSIGFGTLLFVYALVAQGNFKLNGIESGAVLAGRAIGDDYASLIIIGLLTIFSVIVLGLSLVLPEPK